MAKPKSSPKEIMLYENAITIINTLDCTIPNVLESANGFLVSACVTHPAIAKLIPDKIEEMLAQNVACKFKYLIFVGSKKCPLKINLRDSCKGK